MGIASISLVPVNEFDPLVYIHEVAQPNTGYARREPRAGALAFLAPADIFVAAAFRPSAGEPNLQVPSHENDAYLPDYGRLAGRSRRGGL
jgi:hypothetical protein